MAGHGGSGGGRSEAAAMSLAAGGGGKRGRGSEEDVYVDNLHSHKRYLSEIMASSMNGLSVGDSVAHKIMGSPVRLENASCFRDEINMQYSAMSEESDDYQYHATQVNTSGNQTDGMSSPSISPISSPNRLQKTHPWFSPGNPYPLPSCSLSAVVCSIAHRRTQHEGRIPSSPNDTCHGGDLRRTALLRSVQMRVQGPHANDLLFGAEHDRGQEHAHVNADELDYEHKKVEGAELERRSCTKSVQHDESGSPKSFGQRPEHDADFIEECRSDYGVTSLMLNNNDMSGKLLC